jgi:hypothetical protein
MFFILENGKCLDKYVLENTTAQRGKCEILVEISRQN